MRWKKQSLDSCINNVTGLGNWKSVSFRRIQDAAFVKLGKLDPLLVHTGFQRVLRRVAKLSCEEVDAFVVSN
jgi:hypothetical protein